MASRRNDRENTQTVRQNRNRLPNQAELGIEREKTFDVSACFGGRFIVSFSLIILSKKQAKIRLRLLSLMIETAVLFDMAWIIKDFR